MNRKSCTKYRRQLRTCSTRVIWCASLFRRRQTERRTPGSGRRGCGPTILIGSHSSRPSKPLDNRARCQWTSALTASSPDPPANADHIFVIPMKRVRREHRSPQRGPHASGLLQRRQGPGRPCAHARVAVVTSDLLESCPRPIVAKPPECLHHPAANPEVLVGYTLQECCQC